MTCASLMLASAAVFVALSTTSASAGSSGFYPRFASVISGGSSKSRAATNSKGIFGKSNKVTDIAAHFKKTAERLLNGIKSIPENFLEGERLKKIRKAKGLGALTFSQYNFIERSSEDLSKIFRMVITIPFSPEFFFYSYIVFPAMASTNPFAWSAMSSGFDADPEDAMRRIITLEKRRVQTLVGGLVALKGETIEVGAEDKIIRRESELVTIEKALRTSNLSIRKAMSQLEGFFMCENNKKDQVLKLALKDVPGSIVKGCCRSIGVEGLPNIPLINKLNIGEVSKYMDKIRDSDEFLQVNGVGSLRREELRKACHDRCIRASSDSQMRTLLREWLDIACKQTPYNRGAKLVLNEQNRRLALMALHVARDVKQSGFTSLYKSLA